MCKNPIDSVYRIFYARSQALDIINNYKPNEVETLADLLPIELIKDAYELTDTVTLRKRKLTLESMAWLLVGMAIYNDKSMADIVNMLDIVDRSGKPFVAPSALTQRRKISVNLRLKLFLSVRKDIGLSMQDYPTGTDSHCLVLMGFCGEQRILMITPRLLQSLPIVMVKKHSTLSYVWCARWN